jgi:hypothetical protein
MCPSSQVTREAEIGKITVPGQSGQKVHITPFQWKNTGHGGLCMSSQWWKVPKIKGSQSRLAWVKKRDPVSK